MILLFLGCTIFLGASIPNSPNTNELNEAMFKAIEEVRSLSFELEKHERTGKQLGFETWNVQINYTPYWIDMTQTGPEEGPSLYWHENKHNGDARVDPNGFPWVDVFLDPRGKTLTKNAHHTIFDLGFRHFGKVWRSLCYNGNELRPTVSNLGQATLDGREAWVLTVELNDYEFKKVKVRKDENVLDLADRLLVPADKIVQLNSDVDDLFDVSDGQGVLVPSHYARKGKIWIDQETMLPVKQEVYDDIGLYERYVYLKVKVT